MEQLIRFIALLLGGTALLAGASVQDAGRTMTFSAPLDDDNRSVPAALTLDVRPGAETVLSGSLVEPNEMYLVMPVFLDGGVGEGTTVQEIAEFRQQYRDLDADASVTWAMSTRFVFDEGNRAAIAQVLDYVEHHGDTVAYGVGFGNNMDLLEFTQQFDEYLYMFRYNAGGRAGVHEHGTQGGRSVWESIPERFRPVAVVDYSVNQAQMAWLQESYGIDTAFWTATQYNVDQLSGVGSPLLPYYAHQNNTLVPAQGPDSNGGFVVMNSLTVDPIGSRYLSGESRFTIHPADPLTADGMAQIRTIEQYFANPYREQNTVNYLSLLVDINWIWRTPVLKATWDRTMDDLIRREPEVLGVQQFADLWRTAGGNNNEDNSYTLLFRGTGAVARDGHTSDSDMQYLWTETRHERIVLSKRDSEEGWTVIDFTDYAVDMVPVLSTTTLGRDEDVSYVSGRNYKLSPTAPLPPDAWSRIHDRMAAIGFDEPIVSE